MHNQKKNNPPQWTAPANPVSAAIASEHSIKDRARNKSDYYTRTVRGKVQRVKKGR